MTLRLRTLKPEGHSFISVEDAIFILSFFHFLLRPQLFATLAAIVVLLIDLGVAAGTTVVDGALTSGIYNVGRNNARGNGDDGVTQNHDESGEELAETCGGGDVAITDSRQRDDRPIDARRNARELCARLIALHDIHQHAEDADKDDDKEEINKDLRQASANALEQQVALIDECEQVEDAEHTNQSQHSKDAEVAQLRNEDAQQNGPCGHSVNDAEETQRIVTLAGRTVNTQTILHGKEERQEHFEPNDAALDDAHRSKLHRNERFKGEVLDIEHTLSAFNNEASYYSSEDKDVDLLRPTFVLTKEDGVQAFFVPEKSDNAIHRLSWLKPYNSRSHCASSALQRGL